MDSARATASPATVDRFRPAPEGPSVEELDLVLGLLRHDRHGFFGAPGRDLMLHELSTGVGPAPARTYRVLRHVEAQPTGPVTIGHVAELLMCDMARASRLVHGLIDDGLVVLRVPSRDARQRHLELTDRGRRLLAGAAARRRNHLQARLAGWSADEVRTLAHLLGRFTATTTDPPTTDRPPGLPS